jgi:hypothetical protein
MYVEGEIPTLSTNSNNGGFGNGWEGLIGLALVAGLFDGGFGFGGRSGNVGNCATQADLAAGFASNTIQRGVDDILIGQANMQNWINQGFAGVNLGLERGISTTNYNLATGFHGVDNAICTLGYNLTHQISDCCCQTQRAIDGVNYNMATNTGQIVQAINCGNQKIIDYLQSEKIDTLNRKLAVAEGQLSQYAQTNAIVGALRQPCPVPAYVVPNPNCCYTSNGGLTIQ